MKRNLILLSLLIGISFAVSGQKGTLKIFSEMKGISVYLDEQFQGRDIISIDSVVAGSHYLKITKDSVVVLGELVTIKSNEFTTVLVKNNQEIKQKILDSKSDEIQQYKMQRLDIMVSTQYVTESTSKTQSAYYPGFFSTTLGSSKTDVVSNTIPVTDWFVIQGGDRKISFHEFATMTNYQPYFEKLKNETDKVNHYNKNRWKTVLPCVIGGLGLIAIGVAIHPAVNWESESQFDWGQYGEISLYTFGSLITIGGLVSTKREEVNQPNLTMLEVRNQVYLYNKDLKRKLGLPENFEP